MVEKDGVNQTKKGRESVKPRKPLTEEDIKKMTKIDGPPDLFSIMQKGAEEKRKKLDVEKLLITETQPPEKRK